MSVFDLDKTPLPSDWEDLHALFADIRAFVKAHPGAKVISADDPGVNYSPPRVPRMGWSAFREAHDYRDGEQSKVWTIPLSRIRNAIDHSKPEHEQLSIALRTAAGRQALANALSQP